MVNKHTVNYHHIPLQLISKIHPLMFLWISKGFIRIFLELFPKAVYSTTVAERFQIYSVKITANTSLRKKVESVHFYSCPKQKFPAGFYHSLPDRRKLPIPPERRFLNIFFLEEKREWSGWGRGSKAGQKIMELKQLPKLTKVSVTCFDKFRHLCNLYIFGLCFVIQ